MTIIAEVVPGDLNMANAQYWVEECVAQLHIKVETQETADAETWRNLQDAGGTQWIGDISGGKWIVDISDQDPSPRHNISAEG